MVKLRADAWRHRLIVGVVFSAMVLAGVWHSPASAAVTEVEGSAFGYHASVSLFGGPANERGPDPTVTLPPGGGDEQATSPSGSAIYGPATIFSSGPLSVSTQGTTGASGSVTSTATIDNVNTSGDEVFTATQISSTCTATETGVEGSTTITNGTLRTSEGDPDVQGDETDVTLPTQPAPNTAYEGQIETVGDNFRYVFNEQTVNPDGSITVNAAHLYLLGPTAVGDLIIGQVVCGATSDGTGGPTTTVVPGPTTTMPGATTTTVDGPSTTVPGATTTTMPGATTTTVDGATTTTMPGATTTTVDGPTTTTVAVPTTSTTVDDGGAPDDCSTPDGFVSGLIHRLFQRLNVPALERVAQMLCRMGL